MSQNQTVQNVSNMQYEAEHIGVPVMKLPHAHDLPLPGYATAQSAGADLLAAVQSPVVIEPGTFAMIETGLCFALPEGFEAQVRPRSGLAAKNGVTVLNSPGTVDADYRGEVKVILINHGKEAFTVTRGMRIAQMVIAPVSHVRWQLTSFLSSTERGEGGFGSTGTAVKEGK